MKALRHNWVLSYLVIAAFGGLIAYQGCGGSSNDKDAKLPEVRTDQDAPSESAIYMILPEQINFQLPADLSIIQSSVDLQTGIVTLENGDEKIDVLMIDQTSSSRKHAASMVPISLPFKSKYGQGQMWAAVDIDYGHSNPNPYHPEASGLHYNAYLWDSKSDMDYDRAISRPKKATVDLHIYIEGKCPYLLVGRSVKPGLNPSAVFKHKDAEPISCSSNKPSNREIAEIAMKVINDIISSIPEFMDTLNILDKIVFTIAFVVALVYLLWCAMPYILSAIEILFELIAAGLTGTALELAFVAAVSGAGSDDDNGGGGGDSGEDDDSGGGSSGGSSGDTGGGSSGGSGGSESGGGSDGGTTNPPPDTTPPFIKSSGIEMLGDGMFKLKVDIRDDSSGPDKDRMWLQDPSYNWILVGSWNFDIPSGNPVNMTSRPHGVWKFFIEAYDNAGNHLDRTDTGKRIAWVSPQLEWSEITKPGVTGCSTYRVHARGYYGHDDIDWIELYVQKNGQYYKIGQRKSSWRAEWFINPLDYNLNEGTYQLAVTIADKNGLRVDKTDAKAVLTVPSLVIPSENLYSPQIEPSPFVKKVKDIEIVYGNVPNEPKQDHISATIALGGKGINNLYHWRVVVFGLNGISNDFKKVSGWSTANKITCDVDTYQLITGKLTVGAIFSLNGRPQEEYTIHSYTRVRVDKAPPKPDDRKAVVTGPENDSTVSIASPTAEMCIRFAMMDRGGSGTVWFKLRLHHLKSGTIGYSKDPDLKGYWGIAHFGLTRFSPGKVVLEYMSKDRVSNSSGDSWKDTGVWYILDDQK